MTITAIITDNKCHLRFTLILKCRTTRLRLKYFYIRKCTVY